MSKLFYFTCNHGLRKPPKTVSLGYFRFLFNWPTFLESLQIRLSTTKVF